MENQNNERSQSSNNNGIGRKLLRFLRGMPFSFALLFIIIIACVAGSIIPQGSEYSVYIEQYGMTLGKLIWELNLDHVFTCWWFILLAALLCLNLILCSVSRFPAVYRVWKSKEKKSFGMWGSWLTHLGMLLLIIGFAAGQYLSTEAVAYGIPGSSQPLGETGLTLAIEEFQVTLRDDNTVEQYTATLTITNENGETVTGEASVNHPLEAFGYSFYQDSMGWANYLNIYKSGELQKTDLLCAGEYTTPDDQTGLIILFNRFYPDLVQGEDGSLTNASPNVNNPHSLYTIYYNGQRMTMNVTEMGEPITVHEYQFVFYDPVEYTLIVAKKDPTIWLVGIASVIMLLGLFLSFYVKPWEQNREKRNADKSNA